MLADLRPWSSPSLRARILNACLRATVKRSSARLTTVDRRVVHASRLRLARLERLVDRCQPAAEVSSLTVGALGMEQVRALGARNDRGVLYLHGGAYCLGSPRLYRGHAARLSAATAATVYLPAYRLAPEHPLPAALDDAGRAWRWLTGQASAPARTLIAGDSAGGGLALALLMALRDAGSPLPAGGACLSPWTDLTCSGLSLRTNARSDPYLVARLLASAAALYLGDAAPSDPRASPLLGDHHGLPPLHLQVSDSELLRDDTLRLAERARDAGTTVELVRWAGLAHGFQLFAPFLPEAGQALAAIGAFSARVWAGAARGPAQGD